MKVSAKMQYRADHKNIRKSYLCLDNDTVGNTACEKLAEKIPNDKMVMRLIPVKKDWKASIYKAFRRCREGIKVNLIRNYQRWFFQ